MLKKVAGFVVAVLVIVVSLCLAVRAELQEWAMAATAFGSVFTASGVIIWACGAKEKRLILGFIVIGAALITAA